MPNPITDLTEQLQTAALSENMQAINRIVNTYAAITVAVSGSVDALIADIKAMDKPTKAAVKRLPSFQRLLGQVGAGLDDFEGYLKTELRNEIPANAALGAQDSVALIGATVLLATAGQAAQGVTLTAQQAAQAAVQLGFGVKSEIGALDVLAKLLDPGGELFRRINELSNYVGERVAASILEGVALGRNPATIASQITKAFGVGLTDSMRIMRTAQLWSYRTATQSNYQANGIGSWVWYAELSGACMSCVAQHGTIHPASEMLNDHHNGKCTMVPLVPGFNPVEQTGEEWFSGLSEEEQRRMMGPGKYQAWQENKFEFSKLTGEHQDGVYGTMKVEASLKKLLESEGL